MRARQFALRSFLSSGAHPASFEEVRGFIFAVAGTPDLVQPSEWLPEAFEGQTPEFESEDQAREVLGDLMDLYNSAVAGGRRTKRLAPAFLKEATANLNKDAAVRRWSRGFWRGYSWLQDDWTAFLSEDLEEELASIVLVLSFFSSRKMAQACRRETAGDKTLEEIAEIMRSTFGKAMSAYIRMGKSIWKARLRAAPNR